MLTPRKIWSLFSKSLTTNGSSLNARLICEALGDRIVPTVTPLNPDPALGVGALTGAPPETGEPSQQPTPTDPAQGATATTSDPSATTGNEPVAGIADPGGGNPGQQPAPQTPAPADDVTDDTQPINAQPKKDEKPFPTPNATVDFSSIQTGEAYAIRIVIVNIKNETRDTVTVDVTVGKAAKPADIVKKIEEALNAEKFKPPFRVDKDNNTITFAWFDKGNRKGDLSKVEITLYTETDPKSVNKDPIFNNTLDAPKLVGAVGKVKVDVNGKPLGLLPNLPKPKQEEEESVSAETESTDVNAPPPLGNDCQTGDATPSVGTAAPGVPTPDTDLYSLQPIQVDDITHNEGNRCSVPC